ncbi:MAG: signal peptidase I [Candidatus Syntropharchaeia archaeon]
MREMREVAMHKKPSILGTVLTIGIFIGIVFILLFHVVFFTVVVSDSMFPTFKKGDLILMQSITTEPRVGDIITFKTDVYLYPVTHRVVSISDGKIRTKGDARDTVDSWVISKEDVLAKAIHKSEENLSSYLVLETISTYDPERYLTAVRLVNKREASTRSVLEFLKPIEMVRIPPSRSREMIKVIQDRIDLLLKKTEKKLGECVTSVSELVGGIR